MMTRQFRETMFLAVLCFLAVACEQKKADPLVSAPMPRTVKTDFKDYNLVLVSFDALQASRVRALGHSRPTTNNIDRIAREAYTFERCYSVASWTVPASMTWFTGVYPSVHQMTNKYAVYNDERQVFAQIKNQAPRLKTLAEVLKNLGYATAGFTGNAGVSKKFGYDQGFDVYVHDSQVFGRMTKSVPRAIQWLRKNKKQKFFLFLHGYDIHGQSTPKNGYDYRFVSKDYDRRFSGSEQEQELLREEGLDKGQISLRPEDVQFWRAVYDEKVQRADSKFGEFLIELDKLGLREKTILVLTSDHGTELYEHKRFDHGFTLYNELIHVPLIIQLPGQKIGERLSNQVSSVDVMPTLLDLMGVSPEATVNQQCQGQSLTPNFFAKQRHRAVFSETNYRDYTFKRSIIDEERWKLIFTLESKSVELFNLNTDPSETRNLQARYPERARQLKARIYQKFNAMGAKLSAKKWQQGLNPVYPVQGRKK
ncbi:MAG: sulfatase [Planctomycetota bacterium]|nr:sulfatase [Planctomycetota bacterium]